MRAVVTGATGFVGRWLVEELLCQGDDVTVIVRNRDKVPEGWQQKTAVVEAPMERLHALDIGDFDGKKADVFFHLAWAGVGNIERADSQVQFHNVQASYDAVYLAARLGCSRFVNAGSIMEYEAMRYIPSDGAVPGMGNMYNIAKLAADFMAKTLAVQTGLQYINVIISNVYGAGECSDRFLITTLKKMMKNEKIQLTHGNQLYDFIYVSDAVRAIVLAGKEAEPNTACYIGNARQYPLKEFVLRMKSVLESKSELLFGAVEYKGISLTYQEFDAGRLKSMGFVPQISFEQGILMTRDWIDQDN